MSLSKLAVSKPTTVVIIFIILATLILGFFFNSSLVSFSIWLTTNLHLGYFSDR